MQIVLFRKLQASNTFSSEKQKHLILLRFEYACFKYCSFDTFSNNCTTPVVYGYHMGVGYVNLSEWEPICLSSISKER